MLPIHVPCLDMPRFNKHRKSSWDNTDRATRREARTWHFLEPHFPIWLIPARVLQCCEGVCRCSGATLW